MKKNNSNRFKRFFYIVGIITMTIFLQQGLGALENGLARTPPMGWNSWNIFGGNIDEIKIKEIADAMVNSGMRDAGYVYLNIDDNWMKSGRDAGGNLVPDPTRFPGGMKALADYVHSLGLKLGIYGDRGTATCMGIYQSGGQGHEIQDANSYASWGIDYLKYDNCNATLDLRTQYETMRDALAQCGRPIVYSICSWSFPGSWVMDVGNLWRTTGDISASWNSITNIIDINERLDAYAGPGHWNDPDMLEVGNGNLTFEENKSHFSLWCMMAAPLIAGNDLRTMSEQTRSILTNTEVIAVDQDPAGIQGYIVRDNGNLEVWMKPLGNAGGSEKAVVLFNRGTTSATIQVSWEEIGLPGGLAHVRDLWLHEDLGAYDDSYSSSVPAHGVVMLNISSGVATTPPEGTPAPTPIETPVTTDVPGTLTGDVNSSGTIDIVDALLVAQYYVDLNPENFNPMNADVNADGIVNIVDALQIAQCYVGLISCNFGPVQTEPPVVTPVPLDTPVPTWGHGSW
jgi:alpha-galactosidase